MRQALSYTLLLLLMSSPIFTWAQGDIGLHFMPGAIQSQATNPAFMSNKNISIALPGISFGATHSGFTIGDLLQPVNGSDSLRVDIDNALLQMREDNHLQAKMQADVLALNLKFAGFQLGFNIGTKASIFAAYPKDLVRLAWQGNGDYIGQTLSVAPDFQAFAYNEIGINGAIRIQKKLQVGARLKYLIGLADFSLSRNTAQFQTADEFYQLSLLTDVQFNTSTLNLGTVNSFDDLELLEPTFTLSPTTGNKGFAADLGIVYNLNDKISLAASVRDLGFINWTDQVSNYSINGTLNFEGIDVADISEGDEEAMEELVDSLTSSLTIQTSNESYRTNLPTEIYVSGTFSPLKSLRLGALFQSSFFRGRKTSAVALSASKDLGKILTLGLTYATVSKSYQNLGANLHLKLGPVQLYTLSDNIMAFVKPEGTKFFNFRMGMNVAF